MISEATQTAPQLVRALKLRDLVLFHLVAVLGLRHLATSAEFGPSVLMVWLAAAILFFAPQGLAVIELSSRFPNEGGVYFWTKQAFGEGHGFLCGWCYWISNALYYPHLLISTAAIATYIVGKGESGLDKQWIYVLSVTLVALWIAIALNIVGVRTGKWLQNAGGIGTYIPGAVLILFGLYGVMTMAPATEMTAASFMPDFTDAASLNLLATIAFAFAGIELVSTMGDEVEQPRRDLPRSVYIAAPLIALIYILGTGAVLWLAPPQKFDRVTGFMQAINSGASHLGNWLWWVAPLCAALYTVGTIGGVGAWLTGPARVAFVIGLDRYFPQAFGRVHPRWHTPYVAIIAQGALATIFLLLSVLGEGTRVEEVYLILLDTQLLIYFIPYVYLFVVFLLYRRRGDARAEVTLAPGGAMGGWAVGLSGLCVTLLAMIFAMIPPPNTVNPWLFRAKVIGGALGFILFGGAIYWSAKMRK